MFHDKGRRFIWSTGRDVILTELHESGVSMEDIAARLGCTHAQVEYRIGLKRLEAAPVATATAGAPIHPKWFDEDYIRNLREMADG